jgi:hypothetical protein
MVAQLVLDRVRLTLLGEDLGLLRIELRLIVLDQGLNKGGTSRNAFDDDRMCCCSGLNGDLPNSAAMGLVDNMCSPPRW